MINSNNENQDKLQKVTYQTHGTCSKYICISVNENGEVQDAQFIGGCDGNTKGVCALIKGMKAKEVIARLKGITCGNKPTSCPDQLATALQEMGYDISEEELRKIQPNDYIGKPVIARALIAKGYASSIPEVFQSKKMLGSETALAIKKEKLSASDAVKLIRESGGLPVLAHPIQAKKIGTPGSREFYQNMEGIVENLVSCGLGGLECFHPDQDEKQSLRFVQMAQKYDLCITRGSDFHGKDFAEAEDTAQIEETKLIGLDVK